MQSNKQNPIDLIKTGDRGESRESIWRYIEDHIESINEVKWYGTFFMLACEHGRSDIVESMLNDERVDVNQTDKEGCPPFYAAAVNKQIAVCKQLINHRKINPKQIWIDSTIMNVLTDETCLALVKCVVNVGLDISKFYYSHNQTFLHAICKKNFELTFYSLKSKQLFALDMEDETPFHTACAHGAFGIVKFYVDICSDIEEQMKSNNLKTPLHCASEMGQSKIVQLLLDRTKFDPNAIFCENTSVDYAFKSGDFETIKTFYVHGHTDNIDKKKSLVSWLCKNYKYSQITCKQITQIVDEFFEPEPTHQIKSKIFAYGNPQNIMMIKQCKEHKISTCLCCSTESQNCANVQMKCKCADFNEMVDAYCELLTRCDMV